MRIAPKMLHRWAMLLLFASALLLVGASGDRPGQRFDRLGQRAGCRSQRYWFGHRRLG